MYYKNNNTQEIVKTKIFTPGNVITSILGIGAIISGNSILILIVIGIALTNLYLKHKIVNPNIGNYLTGYVVAISFAILFIIFFPISLLLLLWGIVAFFGNKN